MPASKQSLAGGVDTGAHFTPAIAVVMSVATYACICMVEAFRVGVCSCAGSTEWCSSYAEDMHECCRISCKLCPTQSPTQTPTQPGTTWSPTSTPTPTPTHSPTRFPTYPTRPPAPPTGLPTGHPTTVPSTAMEFNSNSPTFSPTQVDY